MEEMTAQQATLFLQAYSGSVKMESRTTKTVLAAVPADKAEYRPHPHSKSAMELVRHIANADNRFVETVLSGVFDPTPIVPEDARTPQEVAAWYEERHAKNFDALARATPEQLTKLVDFRGMMRRPAVMFLPMGLHHAIHHRGQLSAYLRSMGAKVPAIYGESFDTAEAKRAQG